MTKQKLKEAYVNWNKEITNMDTRKKEIFQELQKLCEDKGDGTRWCNVNKLVEELISRGYINYTMSLVREYYRIDGQEEALLKFASLTNNFEI